jgi:hypothetical protein
MPNTYRRRPRCIVDAPDASLVSQMLHRHSRHTVDPQYVSLRLAVVIGSIGRAYLMSTSSVQASRHLPTLLSTPWTSIITCWLLAVGVAVEDDRDSDTTCANNQQGHAWFVTNARYIYYHRNPRAWIIIRSLTGPNWSFTVLKSTSKS